MGGKPRKNAHVANKLSTSKYSSPTMHAGTTSVSAETPTSSSAPPRGLSSFSLSSFCEATRSGCPHTAQTVAAFVSSTLSVNTGKSREKNGIGKLQVRLSAIFAVFGRRTTTQVYYTWGTALMLGTKLINAKKKIKYRTVMLSVDSDMHRVGMHSGHCGRTVQGVGGSTESAQRQLLPQSEMSDCVFLLSLTMVPYVNCFRRFITILWNRMGHPDPHLDVHPLLPYGWLMLTIEASIATAAMTIMPVCMLGAVSAYCDDLVEDLNELRLEHFTDEVDERVAKLERVFKARVCFGGTTFCVLNVLLEPA